MKKLVSVLVALSLVLCCVFGAAAEDKKQYKIGIVLMIENGAFVDMKNGVIKGLNDLGYVEGDNLTID